MQALHFLSPFSACGRRTRLGGILRAFRCPCERANEEADPRGVRPLNLLYLITRLVCRGIARILSPYVVEIPTVVFPVAPVAPHIRIHRSITHPVPIAVRLREAPVGCQRRQGAAHQQHRGYYKHQDFGFQSPPPLSSQQPPVGAAPVVIHPEKYAARVSDPHSPKKDCGRPKV
jgi:hypothetical protein